MENGKWVTIEFNQDSSHHGKITANPIDMIAGLSHVFQADVLWEPGADSHKYAIWTDCKFKDACGLVKSALPGGQFDASEDKNHIKVLTIAL